MGASTIARGLRARRGLGIESSSFNDSFAPPSVVLRYCSKGRRYAKDFPEPVSAARRDCRQVELIGNRFFNASACMGVG